MGSRSVTIPLGLPGLRKNETCEAPRPESGASGKCKCDYKVGFDSNTEVRYRPPRGTSSRLARETFGLGATPFLFPSYGIAARPVLVVKFGKGNEYLKKGEV